MLSVMLYKYNPDDVDPPLLSLHRVRVFKGGKKKAELIQRRKTKRLKVKNYRLRRYQAKAGV